MSRNTPLGRVTSLYRRKALFRLTQGVGVQGLLGLLQFSFLHSFYGAWFPFLWPVGGRALP